jgi:asparagine synthase (glutamine-hydrolysing)
VCGISGIFSLGGERVDPEAIRRMTAVLAHRGPDDEGVHVSGPIGLGHRRLSIIDVAHGQQPMSNEDGKVWTVFNGMVYNYRPLRESLTRAGHRFATDCDTEVLVHGWEEWGVRMLERLNGQFAFGIWDEREGTLFLARDRMGEKPLYYAATGTRLLFASEIKSLLVHVKPEPAIPRDFLVFENTLTDDTMFRGIKELPPAHYLLLHGGVASPLRYWAIPNETDEQISEGEAIRELRDLVVDAVGLRMQSEVPVGMYLSGGLDSSIIACIARPSHVVTSYYDTPGKFDEREPARAVARHIRAEQHFVSLQADEVPALLEDVLYYVDQPLSTSSTISSFNLARHAQPLFKVVLNGQGADELLGGYGRYVLLYHEVELGRTSFFAQYAPMARRLWHPRMFEDPSERYLELNQRISPRTTFPAEVVRRCFSYHQDIVAQMGYTDCVITLPDLIKMDDRGCGHVGLESRSPFLDHRIVELAFRLPARFKIRPAGVTKWILREVAREFVPLEVVERKDKMGMVSPIGLWLKNELGSWASELVAALGERHLDIPLEPPEPDPYDRRLHALVALELWLRHVVEK